MKKIICALLLLGFGLGAHAKEKVTKRRDKFRFGYDFVQQTTVIMGGEDGEIWSIDVVCKFKGSQKCIPTHSIKKGGHDGIDHYLGEYTKAEWRVAEKLMAIGDQRIEQGENQGVESRVVKFVHQDQLYTRIFRYKWHTEDSGEITSILDISQKNRL
ncbi:MAG: hypothetical protein VXX63_03540 [Bacteroidota bacterium]|nr:hypothetical protein [Bacteroidota bacterium]